MADPDPSRDHQRRQHRTELTYERRRNRATGFIVNSVVLKCGKCLKDENAAREESGQQYDWQRSDSDQIHLTNDLARIAMRAEQPRDHTPQKQTYFLKLVNKFCDWIHSAGQNVS
jgi:hypothetical protein